MKQSECGGTFLRIFFDIEYEALSLPEFRKNIWSSQLVCLGMTYLREKTFFTTPAIKLKYRNRFQLESVSWVALLCCLLFTEYTASDGNIITSTGFKRSWKQWLCCRRGNYPTFPWRDWKIAKIAFQHCQCLGRKSNQASQGYESTV
jgi:hypothetical protein